jgi:lambda family phage minor tail protein L
MPETINAGFRDEKNKKENAPITLYEVTLNDASILRLAEWDAVVEYPAGSGNNYLPVPLTHEGVGMNAMGEIDMVKLTLSNVNREIGAVIIANGGLRGNKVTMKTVFSDLLADADANTPEDFWIDTAEIVEEKEEAVFTLTSKLDLFEVMAPGRIMERDHCPWVYKQEGCWRLSGGSYVARGNFTNEGTECDHTRKGQFGCRFHHPAGAIPFGGFPGIPMRGILLQ